MVNGSQLYFSVSSQYTIHSKPGIFNSVSRTHGTPGGTMHFVEPISIDFPYHSVCLQNLCRESESSVS